MSQSPFSASAALSLGLNLADISAEQWHATGISVALDMPIPESGMGRLKVKAIHLSEPVGVLRDLLLECPSLEKLTYRWRCETGTAVIGASAFGAQSATWRGEITGNGEGWLELDGLRFARGSIVLRATLAPSGWQISWRLRNADLARVKRDLPWLGIPADWRVSGRISSTGNVEEKAQGRLTVSGTGRGSALAFASPDQGYEGVGLGWALSFSGYRTTDGWRGNAEGVWQSGQLYADPVFLDIATTPISASVTVSWRRQSLQLDRWRVLRKGSLAASGTATLGLAPFALAAATFSVESRSFERLYTTLLQPYLIGTLGDDLRVSGAGELAGVVTADGLDALDLQLRDVGVEDRRRRFSLRGIDGTAAWRRLGVAPASAIAIAQVEVYRLPGGSFRCAFHAAGDRLALDAPIIVPVLGGAARLDDLQLSGLNSGDFGWQAAAALESISLRALTEALDWPLFNGSLEARLPNISYRNGLFKTGGPLALDVFGGHAEISNLQVRDPLGVAPVVAGAATLRGLDLDELTSAFSFGNIEGRLDGDLDGLELVAWRPNKFSLHLYTSAAGKFKKRISQRAVENLTELGSGVPAGLSATILRVFDDFGYDQIDLELNLDGDEAKVNGIARPDGGYYLVKGAGLPRIDVIGRNRRVAWKDLVQRLQQIQLEGAQIR